MVVDATEGKYLKIDLGQTGLGHGKPGGSPVRQVDNPAFVYQVSAINNANHDRMMVRLVNDANERTKGKGRVAGGQRVHVVALATCCFTPVEYPSIPRGNAVEPVSPLDRSLFRLLSGLRRYKRFRRWACNWRRDCERGSNGTGESRIRMHCPSGNKCNNQSGKRKGRNTRHQPDAQRSVQT